MTHASNHKVYRQPKVDPAIIAAYPVDHSGGSDFFIYDPYYMDLNYKPYLDIDLPPEDFAAFDVRVPDSTSPPTSGIPGCWLPRGMGQMASLDTLFQQDNIPEVPDVPPGAGLPAVQGHPGYNLLPQHGMFWFGYEPVVQGKFFGDIDEGHRQGDEAPKWNGSLGQGEAGGWPRFYPRRMHSWGFVDVAGEGFGIGPTGEQPFRNALDNNVNWGMNTHFTSGVSWTGRVVRPMDQDHWKGLSPNNAYTASGYPVICILRGYKLWMLTAGVEIRSGHRDDDDQDDRLWQSIRPGGTREHASWGEAIHVADIREQEQDKSLRATSTEPAPLPYTWGGANHAYPYAKEFESEWNGLIRGQFFRQVFENPLLGGFGPPTGFPHPVADAGPEQPKVLHSAFKSHAGTAFSTSSGKAARFPAVSAKLYGAGLHCMMYVNRNNKTVTDRFGIGGGISNFLNVWYLNPYKMPGVFQGVTTQGPEGVEGGDGYHGYGGAQQWKDETAGWYEDANIDRNDYPWKEDDYLELSRLVRVAHQDAPYCIGERTDRNQLWAGKCDPYDEFMRSLTIDSGGVRAFPFLHCLKEGAKTLIIEVPSGAEYDHLRPLVLKDYDRRPENSHRGAIEVVQWTMGTEYIGIMGKPGKWVHGGSILPFNSNHTGWWFSTPFVKQSGVWLAEYPKKGTVPENQEHIPIRVERYDTTTEDFYSNRTPSQGHTEYPEIPEAAWPQADGDEWNHCPIAICLTPYDDFVTVSVGYFPHPDDNYPDQYWIVERRGVWKHKIRVPYNLASSTGSGGGFSIFAGNGNRFGDVDPASNNADQFEMHISCDEKWLCLRNFPARYLPYYAPLRDVLRGGFDPTLPPIFDGGTTLPGGEPIEAETRSEYCSDMSWFEGYETLEDSLGGFHEVYKNAGTPAVGADAITESNCCSEWMIDLATGTVRVPWRSVYGNKVNPFRVDTIDNGLEVALDSGRPSGTYTGAGSDAVSIGDPWDQLHINMSTCGAMDTHIHLPGEGLPASSAPSHFF